MSFASEVNAWIAKTNTKTETVVRKIAVDVFGRVIMMSPVDTGRFRGNWQVAIGGPASGTLETTDKSGSATLSEAQTKALSMKVGDVIYMVNNLPYALRLEYGHSGQAPSGMVRIVAAQFSGIVEAMVGSNK